MNQRELLSKYTKDELIDLLTLHSKNFLALDGTWFQSVERRDGMDAAMHHDGEAWKRYTASEARRLKAFLGLGEHPGLEGLARALPLPKSKRKRAPETASVSSSAGAEFSTS